jgi:hypothetical protein
MVNEILKEIEAKFGKCYTDIFVLALIGFTSAMDTYYLDLKDKFEDCVLEGTYDVDGNEVEVDTMYFNDKSFIKRGAK